MHDFQSGQNIVRKKVRIVSTYCHIELLRYSRVPRVISLFMVGYYELWIRCGLFDLVGVYNRMRRNGLWIGNCTIRWEKGDYSSLVWLSHDTNNHRKCRYGHYQVCSPIQIFTTYILSSNHHPSLSWFVTNTTCTLIAHQTAWRLCEISFLRFVIAIAFSKSIRLCVKSTVANGDGSLECEESVNYEECIGSYFKQR